MSRPEPRTLALLARVDDVEARLAAHAVAPPAPGLTDPDPPTGERWDFGQVWAHLGEFVPYWVGETRKVLDPAREEPVPFGRVKTDPARVAAIERDRILRPQELMARLGRHLDDLRALIRSIADSGWDRTGLHSTLGVMDVPRIFQEFLVGHLEAHAAQLDGLRAAARTPIERTEGRDG